MNHKRKRPRSARAGCKRCKHWKVSGVPERELWQFGEWKRLKAAQEAVHEAMRASDSDRR